MGKHVARTEQTKANILRAFWELYQQKDISHITIRELSDAAGVHRTTFYTYFEDIYDVRRQAEQELIHAFLEHLQEMQEHFDVSCIVDFYAKHLDQVHLLTSEHGDPHFLQSLKEILRSYWMEQFAIRKETREIRFLADYQISTILLFFNTWYECYPELPLEDALQLLYEINLKGFVNVLLPHSEDPETLKKFFEL